MVYLPSFLSSLLFSLGSSAAFRLLQKSGIHPPFGWFGSIPPHLPRVSKPTDIYPASAEVEVGVDVAMPPDVPGTCLAVSPMTLALLSGPAWSTKVKTYLETSSEWKKK